MAQITVRASNPGYPGRWRAGSRHWSNNVEYRLTVVDDPPGGPPLGMHEPIDPATGESDMSRISKAGVAELKTDDHISVAEGDSAVATATVDEAVSRSKALAGQVEEMRVANAALTAAGAAKDDEIAALKAQLDVANAALTAAGAAKDDEIAKAGKKNEDKGGSKK